MLHKIKSKIFKKIIINFFYFDFSFFDLFFFDLIILFLKKLKIVIIVDAKKVNITVIKTIIAPIATPGPA